MERYSQKREAILGALKSTYEHPTAEMLYVELKHDYPDISLATVYRNLKLFCKNGDAVSVGIINGYERFDARIENHGHFICSDCNSVKDVCFELDAKEVYGSVEDELGTSIDSHNLMFHGKCASCLGS